MTRNLLIIFAVAAVSAHATTLYTVFDGLNQIVNSPTPHTINDSTTDSTSGATSSETATTSTGTLGVSAVTNMPATTLPASTGLVPSYSGTSLATISNTTFFYTGSTSIAAPLNFTLTGMLSASGIGTLPAYGYATAELQFQVTLDGVTSSGLLFISSDPSSQPSMASGMFSSLSDVGPDSFTAQAFQTDALTINPGNNTLEITANAISFIEDECLVAGCSAGGLNATASFADTIQFVQGSPVVSGLPNGATIQDPGLGIANNLSTATPEPAAAGLVLLGAAILRGLSRLRTRIGQ